MTKKDYVLLASIIKDAATPFGDNVTHGQNTAMFDLGGKSAREFIANRMASELKSDNPNFDRVRFLKACGLPTSTKE